MPRAAFMARRGSRYGHSVEYSSKPNHNEGHSNTLSSRNSRGDTKDYVVIVSNLPFHMDAASCVRYKDVYWKPLKDLIRKVINKEDDGQDLVTQVATPKSVNIEHENPATPATQLKYGYAICTVSQEILARRALRWLGGNIWYGWTLSVLICCQSADKCRVLDSRWTTMFAQPICLNGFSKIDDLLLLRAPPQTPMPPPFMTTSKPQSRVSVPINGCLSKWNTTYTTDPSLVLSPNVVSTCVQLQRDYCKIGSYNYSTTSIMTQMDDNYWPPFGSAFLQLYMPPSPPMSPNTRSSHTKCPSRSSCPWSEDVDFSWQVQYNTLKHSNNDSQMQLGSKKLEADDVMIQTSDDSGKATARVTITVNNLHAKTTNKTLRYFFARLGLESTSIKMLQSISKRSSMALVDFKSLEVADMARSTVHGSFLEGRELYCSLLGGKNFDGVPTAPNSEDFKSRLQGDNNGQLIELSRCPGTQIRSGPVIADGSREYDLSERR